jgi:hypothetical protein
VKTNSKFAEMAVRGCLAFTPADFGKDGINRDRRRPDVHAAPSADRRDLLAILDRVIRRVARRLAREQPDDAAADESPLWPLPVPKAIARSRTVFLNKSSSVLRRSELTGHGIELVATSYAFVEYGTLVNTELGTEKAGLAMTATAQPPLES